MKVRKFYPRSAIRKLEKKAITALTPGDSAALRFVMGRGRRLGVAVMVSPTLDDVSPFNRTLEQVTPEQALTLLANCTTRIWLSGRNAAKQKNKAGQQ